MPKEKEQLEIDESNPIQAKGEEAESANAIDEKKLLRKLDLHLLPGVTLLYLLSFLDRSNGLAVDTNMTGNQYLTTLSIYFIGYSLFDIPCNLVLKLTSPRMWLPTVTLIWGITCTLMGLARSFGGFLTARFFLGVTESGLFPGVMFYFSMWYKRNEQHYRIALFFAAVLVSGAFGGLFAFALSKMNGVGGLGGWRWIFIIEGLMTFVVAIAAYFFIHNYPATATFLTPEESECALERLRTDSDATQDEKFAWAGVLQALKDPKIHLHRLCYHTINLPAYTLILFLPTIIDGLGFTAAQAQLLTIPPYAVSFVTTMGTAVLAERTKRRAPFIIAGSIVGIIGYIMLLASDRLVLSWPANNVSGQTKRVAAHALQIGVGNLGAILGTQLYRPKWSPRDFVGHGTAMGYLVANIFATCLLWYIMKAENERRDRGERDYMLRDAGEDAFLGDDDPRWRFQT